MKNNQNASNQMQVQQQLQMQAQMQMAQQPALVAGVVSKGVELTVTDNPKLKCHIEECPNLGTSTCTFRFLLCCFNNELGCQKRFCQQHGFHPTSRMISAAGNQLNHVARTPCVCCAKVFQDGEVVFAKRSMLFTFSLVAFIFFLLSISFTMSVI